MTLLTERYTELSRRLASTLAKLSENPTPKYVHRLRTAIRRFESLVAYARPDLGRKQRKTVEEMAGLRKRAGRVRDLDVEMGLLKAVANGSTRADRLAVEETLQQKRAKQARRLVSAIKKRRNSKVFLHLERIAGKSAVCSGQQDPLHEAQRGLSALAVGFATHSPSKSEELHEVRIQMKKLRYIAELGEESDEQQRFLDKMKSVQDALGVWHDWEQLAQSVEKKFQDRANCPLLIEVRSLSAAKQAAAKAAVEALFSNRPAEGARKPPRSIQSSRELMQRAG
jgi:CHAD domain-containing protein